MGFSRRYLPLNPSIDKRFTNIENQIIDLQNRDKDLQDQITELDDYLGKLTTPKTPSVSLTDSGRDRRQTTNEASTLNGLTSWVRSWVGNGGNDPSCTLYATWTFPRITLPIDVSNGYYQIGKLYCAMTVRGFSTSTFDLSEARIDMQNKSFYNVKLDGSVISAWAISESNTRVYYRSNGAGGDHNRHTYQVNLRCTSEAIILQFIASSYGEEDDNMSCSMNCTTATPDWNYIM